MVIVSSMASLHSLDQDNWNDVQHDFLVMWCHWHQHHMNKYAPHIMHRCLTALLLWSTYRHNLTAHGSPTKKKTCSSYYKHYCQICAWNKYALHMLCTCNICKLPNVQIWENNISIYTLYELTAINSVTSSTAIHTFHITGICPWTKMSATSHMYVP